MPVPLPVMPDSLRCFSFHGLVLDWEGRKEAVCDCPSCGRGSGKFSVNVDTGEFKCFVCDFKGGPTRFIQWLWEQSDKATVTEYDEYAEDRGLTDPTTLMHWGACCSIITGRWMIPAYNPDGALTQLYKRIQTPERWELRPTPGIGGHALHGIPLLNREADTIYLVESSGNAMALWESLRISKLGETGLEYTGNPASSLLSNSSVLAVANCGAAGESLRRYLPLMQGKRVVLGFDSDHAKEHNGRLIEGAGPQAYKRVAGMLAGTAREVHWIKWGDGGVDSTKPSGWDIRDVLKSASTARQRPASLQRLLQLINPIPSEWTSQATIHRDREMRPLKCQSWSDLREAWANALRWRQGLEDVLAVMLAVALSTDQQGDQLFLQVVGVPGGAKTKFADAMLISHNYCYPLEHLTGFHSGYKDSEDGDYSLLSRIDKKALITPEGDVLWSSPKFMEIMSQMRRIFDGTSGASYKNRKQDLRWTGLRTPWIVCGTPTLLEGEQSRLGDRFVVIRMDDPDVTETKAILATVAKSARSSVRAASNCSPESQLAPEMAKAYRMTGGYVDYLRENSTRLLNSIPLGSGSVELACQDFGDFTSYLRARPNNDPKKPDAEPFKEMATRLTHQFCRIADCLAVVCQRKEVDWYTLRMVKRLSFDSTRVKSFKLLDSLNRCGGDGGYTPTLARWFGMSDERMEKELTFLRDIKAVENFAPQGYYNDALFRWRMTPRMNELWQKVYCNA